jgi:hypothetical protein
MKPTKIYILSNDDLTSNVIFASLFENSNVVVKGITFAASPSREASSKLAGALLLRKRMAAAYWLYLIITNGLFTVFEWITLKFGLKPRVGCLCSLRAMAKENQVPVRSCVDFNDPDFVSELSAMDLDLLVIRIGCILDEAMLNVARHGTWCVHSSLLPAMGGIAGEFHALRLNQPIGSTVFEVTPELDAGPPVAQVPIPVTSTRSLFGHMLTNNQAAGSLLNRMFDEECHRDLHPGELEPSYFSWPKAEELRDFRATGFRLIHLRELVGLAAASLRLRPFVTGV